MRQKHLNLLLFMLIAACAVFAVSCGFYPDTFTREPDKFLFLEIDKGATLLLLAIAGALLIGYWWERIEFLKKNPNLSYDQLYLLAYKQISLVDVVEYFNTAETDDKSLATAEAVVYFAHFEARLVPVMILWSRFIDPWGRGFLYWLFVILTCLALRYGPEMLGINMLGFRKKWIVIWSIICVLFFVIIML